MSIFQIRWLNREIPEIDWDRAEASISDASNTIKTQKQSVSFFCVLRNKTHAKTWFMLQKRGLVLKQDFSWIIVQA